MTTNYRTKLHIGKLDFKPNVGGLHITNAIAVFQFQTQVSDIHFFLDVCLTNVTWPSLFQVSNVLKHRNNHTIQCMRFQSSWVNYIQHVRFKGNRFICGLSSITCKFNRFHTSRHIYHHLSLLMWRLVVGNIWTLFHHLSYQSIFTSHILLVSLPKMCLKIIRIFAFRSRKGNKTSTVMPLKKFITCSRTKMCWLLFTHCTLDLEYPC